MRRLPAESDADFYRRRSEHRMKWAFRCAVVAVGCQLLAVTAHLLSLLIYG